MANLPHGIYEALLDEDLNSVLAQHPELRSVFGKLDPEEQPTRYAAFLARVVEKALRLEADPVTRLRICNEIVERLAGSQSATFINGNRLVIAEKPVLVEITPPRLAEGALPRPETPLTESSLFTGSPSDPQLVHELGREIGSADSVDSRGAGREITLPIPLFRGRRSCVPGK